MNPIEQYVHDRDRQVKKNLDDQYLQMPIHRFTEELIRINYTKSFTWMGIPILQYPSDLMVMQELVWKIKPDYIIETGVAFGGMTVFYASILEMIGKGRVIGIDIEIREHTYTAIYNKLNDSFYHRIKLVEGSSIEPRIVNFVQDHCKGGTILVSLDSNHTRDHVFQELRLYSPLVSLGSYIVVFDTAIEEFGHLDKNQDRPWSKGNNPHTAVMQFMKNNDEFVIDKEVEQRALITAAPSGWLRRIKEIK